MLSAKKLLFVILLAAVGVCSFAQNSLKVETAQKVIAKIDAKKSFVDDLIKALSQRVSLPVGVKRVMGNNEVVIAVDKVKFRKEYTEFSAFVRIETDRKNTKGEDVVCKYTKSRTGS